MANTNSKISTILFHTSRIIFGLVFIFSGFVKAVDPLGGTYKIQDYLNSFGGIWTSISDFAFVLSIALSTIELLIGLLLIFSVKTRLSSFAGLAFMLVMTPLTLYIAIKNPVSDCGCFGEALKISNWATFWKNIALMAVILTLITTGKKQKILLLPHIEWVLAGIFFVTGIGISVYSYNHLPQIDFLPYKVGVNIKEAMSIPEGAKTDQYETTFIYTKDGKEKEFTLENYPEGDTTWTFVDQKTTLIEEGYKPEIHDFSIYNDQNEDIVPEIIEHKGYSYLLVVFDINKASADGLQQASKIYERYKNSSTKFYAVTASLDDDVLEISTKNNIKFPFYKCDPITLKTIIRANPGLVLIKDGTIIGKWHWRDMGNF